MCSASPIHPSELTFLTRSSAALCAEDQSGPWNSNNLGFSPHTAFASCQRVPWGMLSSHLEPESSHHNMRMPVPVSEVKGGLSEPKDVEALFRGSTQRVAISNI
jgi:hypothetical protein